VFGRPRGGVGKCICQRNRRALHATTTSKCIATFQCNVHPGDGSPGQRAQQFTRIDKLIIDDCRNELTGSKMNRLQLLLVERPLNMLRFLHR